MMHFNLYYVCLLLSPRLTCFTVSFTGGTGRRGSELWKLYSIGLGPENNLTSTCSNNRHWRSGIETQQHAIKPTNKLWRTNTEHSFPDTHYMHMSYKNKSTAIDTHIQQTQESSAEAHTETYSYTNIDKLTSQILVLMDTDPWLVYIQPCQDRRDLRTFLMIKMMVTQTPVPISIPPTICWVSSVRYLLPRNRLVFKWKTLRLECGDQPFQTATKKSFDPFAGQHNNTFKEFRNRMSLWV